MKRKQPMILGRQAWIERCKSYDLPEGCPEGAEVSIIGNNLDSMLTTVRDKDGMEWELDSAHIDTGWLYKIGARFYHESTPQAAEYLHETISRYQSLPDSVALSDSNQKIINDCLKVLRRNGHELPQALTT